MTYHFSNVFLFLFFSLYITAKLDDAEKSFPHFIPESIGSSTRNRNQWAVGDSATVKVWPRSQTITFLRKIRGGRAAPHRGIRISKAALEAMEDVSLIPSHTIILEKNVELDYFARAIKLVRYCVSKDGHRCDGGFVIFSEQDWQSFWNNIRPAILDFFKQ